MIANHVTQSMNFYQGHDPRAILAAYGSPLYLYNERILRERCRHMMGLCKYPNFRVNYALKANTNLHLLAIAREEGLCVDASSPGEVMAAEAAGYTADKIMFIVNNAPSNELQFAIDRGLTVSVDSLSQLDMFGQLNPGGKICLRFNPGVGGGHHEKVVTGGDGTKFGITLEHVAQVKSLLTKHKLRLIGINHHIGSLNWGELFVEGEKALLKLAYEFENLEFIDLGGGFAIPYNKQGGEQPLDIAALGEKIDKYLYRFAEKYGKQIQFIIEPGRYVVAECGVLLGTVNAIKANGQIRYAGTDMGFSVLARPTLYDSHHDIEIYREGGAEPGPDTEIINIVGNQCESGDYIAKNRKMPQLQEGDILGVLDAGAYGYSMSSQYNLRLRPPELLIQENGELRLIRNRDTYEAVLGRM
ncbi:MAG: diaminopimelate decarboxylase [Defluviitaleaceae bacterium]|nr:diaminopimelate decarboxylase [Defluviitaleaceae bacterium]